MVSWNEVGNVEVFRSRFVSEAFPHFSSAMSRSVASLSIPDTKLYLLEMNGNWVLHFPQDTLNYIVEQQLQLLVNLFGNFGLPRFRTKLSIVNKRGSA
jgi:hypothetical protein